MDTEQTIPVPAARDERAPGLASRPSVFGRAAAAAAAVAVVATAGLVLYEVRDVLVEVLIGAFLAISLDPPVRWMVRHGVRRGHAVAVIFLVTLAVTGLFLWAFLPPLVRQGASLVSDFPGYVVHLRGQSPLFAKLDDRFHLHDQVSAWVAGLPNQAGRDALGFGQRFMGNVATILLVGVLTIYFMLDLPRLRKGLLSASPRHHRHRLDGVLTVITDKVGSYMIGNFVISGIAGASALLVLALLGVPFAFPLAVVVALTDLIPMVGATLGATACVVAALATTDLWPNTALVALFFVVYQQLENYLIAPRVMRNSVQMPALLVLLSALVGGRLLGLIGALMAIPAAAVIRAVAIPAMRGRRTTEDE